jgi:hypothetical protein
MSKMCFTSLSTKTRPSLPREFFARIYETCETSTPARSESPRPNNEVNEENKDKELEVVNVSCNSGNEESVDRHSMSTSKVSKQQQYNIGNDALPFVPRLFLRPMASSHWNHLQLAHFHSSFDHATRVEQHLNGLAAFRKFFLSFTKLALQAGHVMHCSIRFCHILDILLIMEDINKVIMCQYLTYLLLLLFDKK